MAYIAGIDNGTQSTKVLVYNSETKEVVELASSPHRLISREDGSREQMASWWVHALKDCFDQIDVKIKSQIKAIGVSGQQHGFVPVASDGSVLGPVKLWCDTSTTEECEEITKKLGGREKVIEIAGNEIKTGYTAPKVLYFKKHFHELYDKMRWIMLPHDYLNFFLTGKPSMEYGDASGTAFFDVRTRTWSKEILRAIDSGKDLSECLPPFVSSEEWAGTVCGKAAELLGIPEGAFVSSGGGDNMMGAIGTGTVSEGDLTMSMGTSGTLYGASSSPIVDTLGGLASFCSSTGIWLPLLCTMNCTVSSEVTRALFGQDLNRLNEKASSAPIGCEGVVMLPYFNGERTPNYPNGKGCLFGFTLTNMTEANITRAAMESSVYAMKFGLDAFVSLGFKPKAVRLIGGGSKSPFWRQMVSDVTNLPVSIPENAEAAAFGGVLQALYVLEKKRGAVSSIKEITDAHVHMQEKNACQPDAERHAGYEKAYAAWLKHVELVKPLYK